MSDTDNPRRVFTPQPVPEPLLAAARTLRGAMTDAEQRLWRCLRRKQLGGFRFRRQPPLYRFVLDFYCCEAKLAIELDGGQHNAPDARIQDIARTKYLMDHGIRVLRFWNNEVFRDTDAVLQKIYDVLTEQVNASPPDPDSP